MRKPKKKAEPAIIINPELALPVKIKGLQAEGVAAKAVGAVGWLVGRAVRKYGEAAAEGMGFKVNKKTKKPKKKLKEETLDELTSKGSIDAIGKHHAARSTKGAPNSMYHTIQRNRAARVRDVHKGTGPLGKTTMKSRMPYATDDSKKAKALKENLFKDHPKNINRGNPGSAVSSKSTWSLSPKQRKEIDDREASVQAAKKQFRKLKPMSEAMGYKLQNPQKKIDDMTPDEHLKQIKVHAAGARKFGSTLLGQMHGRHAGRHVHHFLNKDKSREGALKAMAALKEDYDYYVAMTSVGEQTFEEGWKKSKTGGYTAWGSDMSHHKGPIRCPKCRSELHLGIAKPHRDHDNDITHHTASCHKCKADLTIFNDGWEPEGEPLDESAGAEMKKAAMRIKRQGDMQSHHKMMERYHEHMATATAFNRRNARSPQHSQSMRKEAETHMKKADAHRAAYKNHIVSENLTLKNNGATHKSHVVVWPNTVDVQKVTDYHKSETGAKKHISKMKKKYGAGNVEHMIRPIKETTMKTLDQILELSRGKIVDYVHKARADVENKRARGKKLDTASRGAGTYDRATGKVTITKQTSQRKAGAAHKLLVKASDRDYQARKAASKIKEETLEEAKRGRPRKVPDAEGNEHINMQLRKVISLRGKYKVTFGDGSKHDIHPNTAHKALGIHDTMRTSIEKGDFAKRLSHSHGSFQDAVAGKPAVTKKPKITLSPGFGHGLNK
jgi:hypothetical protein